MINRVTWRVKIRSEKKNKQGTAPLVMQVFVNGQRDVIPLHIYIPVKYFDERERRVKSQCAEAIYYNSTIADAVNMAASITHDANIKKIRLDKSIFRQKLTHSVGDFDFIQFWQEELDKRRGIIEDSTWRQQKSSLTKLSQYKSTIRFTDITLSLIEDYERWLKRSKGNGTNTVMAAMKNLRTYINAAIKAGHDIVSPFSKYKIKHGQGRITYCTIEELKELLRCYDSRQLSESLNESLLIFLVECFTAMRISDIKRCESSWINGDAISFIPQKTKRFNKVVEYPLPEVAHRLLADLFARKKVKPLKNDVQINEDLKVIGAFCHVAHSLSTHVGRHTFATTYLSMKGTERGSIEVLRDIMGHSRIETTVRYVHIIMEQKQRQIQNFNQYFK